ncbi:MAG: GIY-YIG nuclease family protein [Flavobacteriales bacterium]
MVIPSACWQCAIAEGGICHYPQPRYLPSLAMQRSYFTYMLTNKNKTVLYVGMTNSLDARLVEHYKGAIARKKSFTARYNCYYCVWFEAFATPRGAIKKEDALKRLSRRAKNEIISTANPDWKFLNEEILRKWPPDEWMMKWLARDENDAIE